MKKLLLIQKKLRVPKAQTNNFGHYKYRSCEDILEAIKPIAHELGCLLVLSDELVLIGERYYIRATATLVDVENNDTITATALARESADKKGMDDSQITGTASSYARKYALNGLFAIDDTKDADTDEPKKSKRAKPQPAPLRQNKDSKEIENLLKSDPGRAKKVLAYYKVSKYTEMTAQQATECLGQLKKKQGYSRPKAAEVDELTAIETKSKSVGVDLASGTDKTVTQPGSFKEFVKEQSVQEPAKYDPNLPMFEQEGIRPFSPVQVRQYIEDSNGLNYAEFINTQPPVTSTYVKIVAQQFTSVNMSNADINTITKFLFGVRFTGFGQLIEHVTIADLRSLTDLLKTEGEAAKMSDNAYIEMNSILELT